jgi:hypothetical protein
MGHDNSNAEDSDARYTKGEYVKITYIILLGYILISKGYLKDKVIGVKVNYLRGYAYTINGS